MLFYVISILNPGRSDIIFRAGIVWNFLWGKRLPHMTFIVRSGCRRFLNKHLILCWLLQHCERGHVRSIIFANNFSWSKVACTNRPFLHSSELPVTCLGPLAHFALAFAYLRNVKKNACSAGLSKDSAPSCDHFGRHGE